MKQNGLVFTLHLYNNIIVCCVCVLPNNKTYSLYQLLTNISVILTFSYDTVLLQDFHVDLN